MLRRNRIIGEELKKWYKSGDIDKVTFEKLCKNYNNTEEDVDSIMRWSVILGIILIFIGIMFFGVVIIESLLYTSIGILTFLVISGFYIGFKFIKKTGKYYYPKTGNSIIVASFFIFMADTYFMTIKFGLGYKKSIALVLMLWSVVYGVIAYVKLKRLFLIMADLSIIFLMGSILSIFYNAPLNYNGKIYYESLFLMGVFFFMIGYTHNFIRYKLNNQFKQIHYIYSILSINISLLGLSVFNEYGEKIINVKNYAREKSLIILFWALICTILFYIGKKYNNRIFKIHSVLFLLVNVYIRYFEFFWDKMNKGLFFLVLGFLSTAIGIYFENIYRKRWR